MKLIKRIPAFFLITVTAVLLISFSALAAVNPLSPKGLKASDVKADRVSISWNKSVAADSYRVYVSENGEWKKLKDMKERSCEISGLDASRTYSFAVRSVNESGEKKSFSLAYSTVTVKTADLSSTSLSSVAGVNYVKLSWEKAAGATGYSVYRKTDGKWSFVKKLSSSTLKYTVSGLDADTTYQFRIRPFTSGDGEKLYGPYSNTVKVRTFKENKVKLSVKKNTIKTVTLSWKRIADATGYRVYRYTDGKLKIITTINSADTLSTVIRSLKSDSKYKFRVRAFRDTADGRIWFAEGNTVTAFTDPSGKKLTLSKTEKIRKILNGESFTLNYTSQDNDYGKVHVTVAKSADKYYLYSNVNETEYIVLDTVEADYIIIDNKKVYMDVPTAISFVADVKDTVDSLLPEKGWKGSVAVGEFNGKKTVCETYTNSLKSKTLKYHYKAGELVGIEEYGVKNKLVESASIISLVSTADNNLFSIPDGYEKISLG